jgi:hypothetical protein
LRGALSSSGALRGAKKRVSRSVDKRQRAENVRSRDAIAIVDNDRHRLDDFVILNSATAGHERYRGSNVMDTKLAVLDSIDTFLLRITKAPVIKGKLGIAGGCEGDEKPESAHHRASKRCCSHDRSFLPTDFLKGCGL